MISPRQRPLPANTRNSRQTSTPPAGFEPAIPAKRAGAYYHLRAWLHWSQNQHNTTQQPGQTPDKEVKINHHIVHVSGYTEHDATGKLSASWCLLFGPTKLSQQSGQTPAAVSIRFECWINGQNVSGRTCYRCPAFWGPKRQKKYHNRDLKSTTLGWNRRGIKCHNTAMKTLMNCSTNYLFTQKINFVHYISER